MDVIDFEVSGDLPVKSIKCFTTRPDTLFGFFFGSFNDHEISKYYKNDKKVHLKFKAVVKTGTIERPLPLEKN